MKIFQCVFVITVFFFLVVSSVSVIAIEIYEVIPPVITTNPFDLPDPSAECLDCHRKTSPQIVADYQKSRHYRQRVGCVDCHSGSGHGIDPADMLAGNASGNQACPGCHSEEFNEHRDSRHFQSREKMLSSGAYQVIPGKMISAATCEQCHSINKRCDFCHTRHRFDPAEAKKPAACLPCHQGKGYGQFEYYNASLHGVIYQFEPQSNRAPTCATCHLDRTHNVSFGITRGGVGVGNFLEGEETFHLMPAGRISQATFDKNRSYMVKICSNCHSAKYSRWHLENADTVTRKSQLILGKAKAVILNLSELNLIEPDVSTRPPHPSLGEKMVLGGMQTFTNQSKVEDIFYNMLNYLQPTTFKGAYHGAPGFTTLEGWIPLNRNLTALKQEALRLKEMRLIRARQRIDQEDLKQLQREEFQPNYLEELEK